MLIANPIYDSVFKFLLEDLSVAKRFLSRILLEEIESLEIKPQEQTATSKKHLLTVYRLDFRAVIKTLISAEEKDAAGKVIKPAVYTYKKVLIELQKGKKLVDVLRFRRYLGDNYSKPDYIDGEKVALPIMTIYFLGFELSEQKPILRIMRSYRNGKGELLSVKDDFIERLTHDCIVVQIRLLLGDTQDALEKLLSVFNQKWIVSEDKKWILRYPEEDIENIADEDLKAVIKRLFFACQDEDVQKDIETEENFDESLDDALRAKDVVIWEKEKALENKSKELENKDKELEKIKKETAERDAYILALEERLKKNDS